MASAPALARLSKVGEAIADLAHFPVTLLLLVTGYNSTRLVRSAWRNCSQSDCKHRENYKGCSNIAHGRTCVIVGSELIFSAYNYEVDRTIIL
jgi:hypothetical protein